LLEVGGLLLILWITAPAWQQLPTVVSEAKPGFSSAALGGLFGGAFLAFYAYVGFEDMVNVAEEVKNPQRNMPIAILLALAIATVLYILVAISSLLVLNPQELGRSDAPLASIYETVTGNSPWLISLVSLFAVINGALIQIIMGSRVCYGLARQNRLPDYIGRVNSKTRTPINATLLVSLIILIAALILPIETLANTTTYLLLIVFSLVNLALVRIKLGKGAVEEEAKTESTIASEEGEKYL
jgi:basic amino acid/polyamine antiporter, APA family